MVQVGFLNVLDLLLLLILFIGIIIGFLRGALTQIISLASIWLGLLLTLWLYKLFSKYILQEIMNPNNADTMAFLILLIVFFNAIRLIVKSLTAPPEQKGHQKKRKKNPDDPLDEAPRSAREKYIVGPFGAIGGMVMGLILTIVWLSIILGVLQFTFQIDAASVGGVEVSGRGVANQLRSSALVPYFNRVLWLIVQSLSLFLLDPSADILQRVVESLTGAANN
jgi:hypothetical protein